MITNKMFVEKLDISLEIAERKETIKLTYTKKKLAKNLTRTNYCFGNSHIPTVQSTWIVDQQIT